VKARRHHTRQFWDEIAQIQGERIKTLQELRLLLVEVRESWLRKPGAKKERRYKAIHNQILQIEKGMEQRAEIAKLRADAHVEAKVQKDIASVIRDQARKRAAPWEGRGNRD
jgi:hypothetical protein